LTLLGIKRPDPKVVRYVWENFSPQMSGVETSEEALLLYSRARQVPTSSTKGLVVKKFDLVFDSPFHQQSSKALLMNGFHNGKPVVVKLYHERLQAEREDVFINLVRGTGFFSL
jgi:hypothetical protein